MTYISASIQFLDCRLSLIHIPLHLYPHFVRAILSLILPLSSTRKDVNFPQNRNLALLSRLFQEENTSRAFRDFVNISFTPIECSVVCSKEAAQKLFNPIIESLSDGLRDDVMIAHDEFLVLQVDGEGLDAGKRVLDLTSPLAFAGISIFFITTYFSDYILVPAKHRTQVVKALERQGFIFEKHSESFVVPHHRSSSTSSISAPSTPVPTTLEELEVKTFTTLKARGVVPRVYTEKGLILCAGRKSINGDSANAKADDSLYLGLVNCIVNKPQFFSVTLTDQEPASLMLEKDSLPLFGAEEVLLGSRDDVLIPIVLDLRDLPVECAGIVCGVAGRLVGGTRNGIFIDLDSVQMSYLSTARAGTVMVAEQDITRAIAALAF